jgi:peptidoglycan/LPS O-acetylase OafA/YrhL
MSPPSDIRDSVKAEYCNVQRGPALSRIRTFDFLRGLAILGVIIVHTSQSFSSGISIVDHFAGFGRFGVQLFFLISACTMCHMWKLREGESSPLRNFYIRRIFRIAPLFWLAIPLYILVNATNENHLGPENIGKLEVFLTATFFHGFWPTSINSVVPGGWSIAVEMTFYALFPVLILKIKDRAVLYLLLAIIIWGLNILIFKDLASSFFINYHSAISTTVVKDFLYFNFINQAPIFLLGLYIYFSLSKKFKKTEVILFSRP